MSEEEILTGKAKKAKRSEERRGLSKKRKRDDDAPNTDTADTTTNPTDDAAAEAKAAKRQRRAEAKAAAKKAAKEATAPERAKKMEQRLKRREKKKVKMEKTAAALGLDPSKKLKCSPRSLRKREKELKEAQAAAQQQEGTEEEEEGGEGKTQRFICFIGNLPFTATTETVEKHFAALAPSAVRHRTDPKTGKSKGFAFVEFAHFDRMKTCLEKFHHSEFDSGVPGDKARRINVELTAGGGGKGDVRSQKLKGKNERLEAQRKRKTEAKVKKEARKKAKDEKAKTNALAKRRNSSSGKGENIGKAPGVPEGMHPARLALLQGR